MWAPTCPAKCNKAEAFGARGKCEFLQSAYILAGLAMMLNIRLSYSSAPYALIRFRLPENLFSVFVRRMASSLELWCLPGFIIADIMEHAVKGVITEDNTPDAKWKKFHWIIVPSIIAQWLNFLTYVILLFVYRGGGDQGHLTRFYWVIAVSGFVFGISNPLVFAADYNYIPIYIAGENCFPALTSFIHYLATLTFGNRRKYNSDYLIVYIDILVAIIISLVAAMLWTLGYGIFTSGTGDTAAQGYGHIFAEGFSGGTSASPHMAAPLLIVLVGMGLVYAIYPGIAPGMIVPFYLVDKIEMVLLIATIFPPVIIAILRIHHPNWSPTTKYVWHGTNRIGNGFNGWTWYQDHQGDPNNNESGSEPKECTDPLPPGKGTHVDVHAYLWHFFDLVIPLMIVLAYIFIYSLHYRDSKLSRSIVNQPKMSTFLTIVFYMCHEISLAVGFAGMVGNGANWTVLAQMIGAFLMVFLALYSEGYIIEYKSHDPAHWETERIWYLYGYYQMNPHFFIMIKFNVCSDGYCDFK